MKVLPRGRVDLARQVAIWSGFAIAYELARGFADRNAEIALANGGAVLRFERWLHLFFEQRLQRDLLDVGGLVTAVGWTYWLSQFAVVGMAVAWVYFRRHDSYPHVRNAIIVTNTLGLVGYILWPCAPPRLLPGLVEDTLANSNVLNHGDGLVSLAENPYAAMPSLHTADALIIGISLAMLVRSRWLRVLWLLWPAWVGFSLVTTGNHFWLDIVAGGLLVTVSLPLTSALERLHWQHRRVASISPG